MHIPKMYAYWRPVNTAVHRQEASNFARTHKQCSKHQQHIWPYPIPASCLTGFKIQWWHIRVLSLTYHSFLPAFLGILPRPGSLSSTCVLGFLSVSSLDLGSPQLLFSSNLSILKFASRTNVCRHTLRIELMLAQEIIRNSVQ